MSGQCGSHGVVVSDYLDGHLDRADEAVNLAYQALNAQTPNITYQNSNAGNLDGDLVWTPGITGTAPGAAPIGTVSVNVPTAPTLQTINQIDLGNKPTLDASKPSSGMPLAPTSGNVALVSSPNVDTDLDIPPAPNLDFGAPPVLTPIIIPTILPLNIPDFDAVAPDPSIIAPPDGKFDYTDGGMYTNDVELQVVDRMAQMRDNDWGIPDHIWELAWQQGREREQVATNQMLDEIDVDMASRGFSMPQGIQLARRDKANQEHLSKTITINREQVIAQEKEKTENFRFHVQQGIAFEQVRGQWYNESQNRILDAAKYAFNATLELFRANVEFFNAQVLIFKTEAEVYKIEVDAEVARLEAQKVELEAQKLVSEINKDAVAIYTAEIEALDAKANVYKTQVEAAVAVLEAAKVEVSLYAQDINNYTAKWNGAQIDAGIYKTKVDAKGVEFNNYATAAQAFGTEMQGYKIDADAQISINEGINQHNNNLVSQYDTRIKGLNLDLQAQIADIESQVSTFNASIDLYKAEASVSKSNVDATISMHGNQVQYATQGTQSSIQNAKSASDNSLANANASVERTNAIGQLYTGLASASVSAANISLSNGFSDSISCSTSYGY